MVIGQRVAICSGDMNEFLGFGTYQGNQPCPLLGGTPNPKLVNDEGEVFWGCQTWWSTEDRFREIVGNTPEGKEWLKAIYSKKEATA